MKFEVLRGHDPLLEASRRLLTGSRRTGTAHGSIKLDYMYRDECDSSNIRHSEADFYIATKTYRSPTCSGQVGCCILVDYLLTPWSRVLLEKLTSKLCR